jgi:hypothetical protein
MRHQIFNETFLSVNIDTMNTRTGPVRKIISLYSNIFCENIIPTASTISSCFLIKEIPDKIKSLKTIQQLVH